MGSEGIIALSILGVVVLLLLMNKMPLSFAAIRGGNFSIIGSSSMLNAVSQVEQHTGEKVGLFVPTPMALLTIFFLFIFYVTVGYRLQNRVFRFEDTPIPFDLRDTDGGIDEKPWKRHFALITFILCITGFVVGLKQFYF